MSLAMRVYTTPSAFSCAAQAVLISSFRFRTSRMQIKICNPDGVKWVEGLGRSEQREEPLGYIGHFISFRMWMGVKTRSRWYSIWCQTLTAFPVASVA